MIYDISYFRKMWKLVNSIISFSSNETSSATNRDTTSLYELFSQITSSREKKAEEEKKAQRRKGKAENELTISKENQIINFSHVSEAELYEPDILLIKKYVGKVYSKLLLKPIPDKHNTQNFCTAYSLLKLEKDKTLVNTLIRESLSEDDITAIVDINVSKNLKTIFDILSISPSDMDKVLEIHLNKKGITAKFLSKKSRDVGYTTLEYIAQELTSRFINTNTLELKNGYIDSKRSNAEMDIIFDKIDHTKSCKEYYETYPITPDDLMYGRFRKVDDAESDSELEILSLYYKKLKPLERKMIYNLIYELTYNEYKIALERYRNQFKKNLPEIDNKEIHSPVNYFRSYAGELILNNISNKN